MASRNLVTVALHLPVILLLTSLLALIFRSLYRLSPLHPLSRTPGPYLPRISSLWLTYHAWAGDEASTVHALHQKYGSIVCTGPNSVDIADGEALQAIYIRKGGFRKPGFYLNFMVDGHRTLFSEIDPVRWGTRAKVVLPAFSPASLRSRRDVVIKCAKEWIDVMKMEAKSGRPVDVLGLARSFAADSVAESLFGTEYGALARSRAAATSRSQGTTSDVEAVRADGMIDAYDAVGRYWYLSPWAFAWAEWLRMKLVSDAGLYYTFDMLENFGIKAVDAATSQKQKFGGTFQGRLLEAGISESEARAQVKDGMFAGIDTTGLNLALIIHKLTKHPDKYEALKKEIADSNPNDDEVQSLPYLRAVVQEGLRTSMANPTRFPRIVPSEGWHFHEMFFPAGVEVSCSMMELHNDGDIYENPCHFQPERWLSASREMYRDTIPFGVGTRRCIAMNLALMELYCAVYQLAKDDVLAGAKCCQKELEIIEFFNIKVVGGRIDLRWKT